MNKDLTVGKPGSVLFKFCIPLFASMIFQQLYNIADSFVAGKFVGEHALAAVGNSYEITLIFIAFAFGCNIGCSVIVSNLFGAKDYGKLKTAVYTALISTGVICLVLVTLGLVFCNQLLSLIHTPEDILFESALYLRIYIYSIPFVFFYNVATGIFSAMGDSKTPFFFLLFSSVGNIGVDILFTAKMTNIFTHGVDGVAWATFICQGISCVLALFFVMKRLNGFATDTQVKVFSFDLMKKIERIAIPSTLQQSFISVGNIIIQGIINSFGTGVIAGYAASVKINNLLITSLTTLGNGISNFTAQNLGACKYSRIREGHKAGCILMWAICVPATLLYFFAGKYLVHIFLDTPSAQALSSGTMFLRIVCPFYCMIAVKLVSDGVLRGSGLMRQFMIGTFSDLILRVVLATVLSRTALGSTGIWMAWPVGWLMAVIVSYSFYKQAVKLLEHKAENI